MEAIEALIAARRNQPEGDFTMVNYTLHSLSLPESGIINSKLVE